MMTMNEECRRCRTAKSVFWWPFSMSDKNTIYLCDRCAYEFIRWLDTPPEGKE